VARKVTSRHSRFGTTITVKLNPEKRAPPAADSNAADSQPLASSSRSFVLHRQQAIHAESGAILDMNKRQRNRKVNKLDDLAIQDNLSMEAKVILQSFAGEFVGSCYNRTSIFNLFQCFCLPSLSISYLAFLAALLKDIRSERPKITEKDNLRLLYMTKWFLEFFLTMHSNEQRSKDGGNKWNFGLVAEVTERSWIIWVLKRTRGAVEEKVTPPNN